MRLVFVHGMRQEGRPSEQLRAAWRDALFGRWRELGLSDPGIEPVMPYYGDRLDQLTRSLRTDDVVRARGGAPSATSPTEEAMLRELKDAHGITDAEVRAQLGAEVVSRGPANWEWVQGIARVLETRVPGFRRLGVALVVQVDAYLNRPHVTAEIDAIVKPAFSPGPVVIVAHSLGTVVSYRLLASAGAAEVPLFVTLGSPLGINAVKDRLRPPKLARPASVARWLNGCDPRDFVSLYAALDDQTFCAGIDNIVDISNRHEDAHAILDYLRDERVARAIHGALVETGST
jgi:pimeloyl-ACP methyl ester carboxylesterase